MRIGILTLPLHTNYGGILQAYALQTVLERMGHEVLVIDRKPCQVNFPAYRWMLIYLKRFIKKFLFRKQQIFFLEKHNEKVRPIIQKNTDVFIGNYIHRYLVDDYSELSKKSDLFDAIVVGSDQIWRPVMIGHIEDAFLAFVKDAKLKRIAYAASFGVDKWEFSQDETLHCQSLVAKFNGVSVREQSGVLLCRKYLKCNAEWVLDPTMLLSVKDYVSLFKKAAITKSEGTLLNYILDDTPQKMQVIENIAKMKKLKPFRVGSKIEDEYAPLGERIQPPVETWLRGFYDAEFVVTDSFHACVFSIIFKKQFVVVGNKERGLARFESLLKLFGLEDRLIDEKCDFSKLKDIDYDTVYAKYELLKSSSLSFLQGNLDSNNDFFYKK